MALPFLTSILLLTLFIACSAMLAQSHVEETTTPNTTSLTLEWPFPTYPFGAEEDGEYSELFGPGPEPDTDSTIKDTRRALFWHRVRYYISYGALSANRIPCPPRSGRSYYTHNCYLARGPAHPYSRGCSRISRCRR